MLGYNWFCSDTPLTEIYKSGEFFKSRRHWRDQKKNKTKHTHPPTTLPHPPNKQNRNIFYLTSLNSRWILFTDHYVEQTKRFLHRIRNFSKPRLSRQSPLLDSRNITIVVLVDPFRGPQVSLSPFLVGKPLSRIGSTGVFLWHMFLDT